MLIVDTGPIVAYLNRNDPDHARCAALLETRTDDLQQTDITTGDLNRVTELMRQHSGFPLGIADASVVAVAERLKAEEVATLDRRHFHAVTPNHRPALKLLP